MIQGNERLQKAVRQVAAKGEPVALIGAVGSGKSTVIESLALNEGVQSLLSLRETQVKGSVSQTNIVITDFPEIPEDCLIVTAKLRSRTAIDLVDDNVLLGKIIYSAFKKTQSGNKEDYRKNLAKQLERELEHPANDTLAYLLQKIKKEDKTKLLNAIGSLPFEKIGFLYSEAFVKNNNSSKNADLIFSYLLTKSKECQEGIEAFWKIVLELVNKGYEALKLKLEKYKLVLEDSSKRMCEFIAVFDKDTMEDDAEMEIANALLNPAYSEEYLLEDTTLIFRGRKDLFKADGDFFTVSEKEDGEGKIHCIRLIDTMGLFHATEATSNNEISRIIDILTGYHCDKMVFVMSAENSDITQKTEDALYKFLTDVNRDFSIYFLYTHWDSYLYSCSINRRTISKFNANKLDWSEIYNDAKDFLNRRARLLDSALKANDSKRKPTIKGFYHAAVVSEVNAIRTALGNNNVLYSEACNNIIMDMVSDTKEEMKYRVKRLDKDYHATIGKKKNSLDSLYQNLIECKDKKLYPATVRECVNKWRNYGAVYESHILQNDCGYENVTTTFVQEIRNYFLSLLKSIDSPDYTDILVDPSQNEKFKEDLMKYFTSNQNLGRKAAKLIAEDAFEHEDRHKKYLNECFHDMLQFIQENYFPSKDVVCTFKSEECLSKAINECMHDFINERCTVVY